MFSECGLLIDGCCHRCHKTAAGAIERFLTTKQNGTTTMPTEWDRSGCEWGRTAV
jgi:hypothetical protein